MKKVIVLLVCFLLVFIIYKITYNNKIDYLALGDGIALGQTYYGTVGYGYTDYVADYLKDKDKLKSYNKSFAENHITVRELINYIENNKTEIVDGKTLYINNAIAEAEIITISIGNYEISDINKYINSNYETLIKTENLINSIINVIDLVRKYNNNAKIYLIGFYSYGKENNDEIIQYVDKKLKKISKNKNFTFIKISDIFKENIKYLPNTLANYPSRLGYKNISKKVIKQIELDGLK